ncbi:MAG: hypothetical protein L0387_37250 [Acidobacteria bacterium]|nr:hypothetical protein [Acidobacteriota bacterium]
MNLDFEQVDVSALKQEPGERLPFGSVRDLLPGWALLLDNKPVERIPFIDLGSSRYFLTEAPKYSAPFFALGTTDWVIRQQASNPGNYSIYVILPPGREYSLVQRGEVPVWAAAVQFAGGYTTTIENAMSLNGERLQFVNVQGGGSGVSQFSGQDVEFVIPFRNSSGLFEDGIEGIDRIQFVPEPGALCLWLLGGSFLLAHAIFRRTG